MAEHECKKAGGERLDRRSAGNRRMRRQPLFSRYLFIGRRRMVRRREDQCQPHQLDRYSLGTLVFFLLFVILSMADAVLTLELVDRNAVELNPVMAYFLGKGTTVFVLAKYSITSISVLLILYLQGSHLFQTRLRALLLFILLLAPFSLVVPYQLHLLTVVGSGVAP